MLQARLTAAAVGMAWPWGTRCMFEQHCEEHGRPWVCQRSERQKDQRAWPWFGGYGSHVRAVDGLL